jgi:hypothetical protein
MDWQECRPGLGIIEIPGVQSAKKKIVDKNQELYYIVLN